jgi:hypothetical protein
LSKGRIFDGVAQIPDKPVLRGSNVFDEPFVTCENDSGISFGEKSTPNVPG